MYGDKYDKVQVEKIDLDTVGVAYLHGVNRGDKVEVLKSGKATEEDLSNPRILCIEVGGSGRIAEGNFDHHDMPVVVPVGVGTIYSACRQAWAVVPCHYCGSRYGDSERLSYIAWGPELRTACNNGENKRLARVVDYIDCLDIRGPEDFGRRIGNMFPTLSDVFAGMLLVVKDSVEQLHLGVEILQKVVEHGLGGINPYGRMPVEEIPEWKAWIEAKAENNRQMLQVVKQAQQGTTQSGLKMAWLETDFFGAPGALYGIGAQVVVAFSPHFGPNKVPKFTVAGNDVRVDKVLPELNAREPGWGGPATGTIIGSPREGSKLTLAEVVEIVKRL
jgi:hypothetical protein